MDRICFCLNPASSFSSRSFEIFPKHLGTVKSPQTHFDHFCRFYTRVCFSITIYIFLFTYSQCITVYNGIAHTDLLSQLFLCQKCLDKSWPGLSSHLDMSLSSENSGCALRQTKSGLSLAVSLPGIKRFCKLHSKYLVCNIFRHAARAC